VPAGSPAMTLTVNGANFTAGAQVLWNGAPLATQFVSSTQLRAQLDAALLAQGQTVGVAVQNTAPETAISDDRPFEVKAATDTVIYMPFISR